MIIPLSTQIIFHIQANPTLLFNFFSIVRTWFFIYFVLFHSLLFSLVSVDDMKAMIIGIRKLLRIIRTPPFSTSINMELPPNSNLNPDDPDDRPFEAFIR